MEWSEVGTGTKEDRSQRVATPSNFARLHVKAGFLKFNIIYPNLFRNIQNIFLSRDHGP